MLVGHSFRFGHKQAGNAARLQELGAQFGFDVEIVEPVTVDGEVVSSSVVRAAIGEGRVARAAQLLGRPFALTGAVRRGSGRGSTIVVPTLNLAPEQELLPKTGVYATETLVGERIYRSATNVGMRPTFDGEALSVESHLFDFSRDCDQRRSWRCDSGSGCATRGNFRTPRNCASRLPPTWNRPVTFSSGWTNPAPASRACLRRVSQSSCRSFQLEGLRP